jgi:hypothetical protein
VHRLRLVDPNNDRLQGGHKTGILQYGAGLFTVYGPSEWFSIDRTSLPVLPYQQLKLSVRCPQQPCSLRGSAAQGGARSSCTPRVLGRTGKNGPERRYGNHMTKERGFLTTRDASRVCFRLSSQRLSWATVCCLSCPLSLTISDYDVIGDGSIGRSSFSNLVQLDSSLASGDVSDIPLNGYLVGLHLVQNDRTGERLIVGGADDGSLAIWSLE